MLVVNVVFLIPAVCFAANFAATIDAAASTTKLKRVAVNPDHDTYNNQEQFRGTPSTPRTSPLQDINSRPSPHYRNAKATDNRKVSYSNPKPGLHAYGSVPKRQFPYASSPIHQTEPRQNSPLAPYFDVLNNPVTYKGTTSGAKPLDASKAIVSQSLQKLQGTYTPTYNALHRDKSIELSDFSDSDYPSYASISKIISQGFPNIVPSTTAQVPVYKTGYSLPKVTEYANVYAPSLTPAVSSATSLFQSSDKTKQGSKQSDEDNAANGKKLPVPIVQLQSNQDISDVFPAFASQPFLLSASYPLESNLGFTYGDGPKFNMALQSRNASPFLSPLSSFQGQIVPIQTAGSTPQFPQYKGASVQVYPLSSSAPKARGSYESFYNQPQLHFGKTHGGQSANAQQSGERPSTEDIIEDVELVNKKNPEPYHPQTDDNDEDDERYKSPEVKYEHSYEDDEAGPAMYFKEPSMESDFKPSTSFPFKEYDERFGKHTAHIDSEDDIEDKPYSSFKNPSSSDIDDEENEDTSSEYNRAENIESSRPSHDSYEEEDDEEEEVTAAAVEEEEEGEEEEESRKDERREETDEESYEVEPKQSKYYGKDFEQEFEESYKKELPKHRYDHVKEVPEVESYDDPKSPEHRPKDDGRSRVNQEERSDESKGKQPRASRKNRKITKTGYRDSAAYGSDVSAKKAPKVIYEEFFGYKNPRTGKYYSKRAKTGTGKYSPVRKSPKDDDYLRAAKYYKFKSPRTGGDPAVKGEYPLAYSVASNRKPDTESPVVIAHHRPESNVRQLSSDPGDAISSYAQGAVSGVRARTNAEILRDLTGI